MKYRRPFFLVFLLFCGLIPNFVCSKNPRNAEVRSVDHQTDFLEVTSLCDLYKEPLNDDIKEIRIKTTLYRVNGITTVGDEDCVSAHPLVDVVFTSEFESVACRSGDGPKEFCAIAQATSQGGDFGNFEIVASIIGRFDSYPSNQGFTANGRRYRLYVERIENVKSLGQVKTIRPS